jgi:hypothetical protein
VWVKLGDGWEIDEDGVTIETQNGADRLNAGTVIGPG